MNIEELQSLIKRLVSEASVIAPSIIHFDKDRKYGRVTDEELDFDSLSGWEIESKALLKKLLTSDPSVFQDSYEKYLNIEEKSQKHHSRSIFVHQIRQLLGGTLALIDSPLFSGDLSDKVSKAVSCDVIPGYAFIAMPMDPDDHSLIDVLEAVKDAATKCGVNVERIDEVQSNEPITDRILESIQRAEYIIVDLTHSKPNVFFESGYAHGLGKIPIYFAKQGTKIEFDLKDYPVLFYRNLKELKDSLEKRIKGLKIKEGFETITMETDSLSANVLQKEKSKKAIISENNEIKIHKGLSRAVAEIASSTGVEIRDIGIHLWLITESSKHGKVLQRVARVRMSDTTPSETYCWKKGEGVVGQCWEKQTDIALNISDSLNMSAVDWNAQTFDCRMGMSHNQFLESTKYFKAIFSSPIVPEYETVGCISLNFDKDVVKAFEELWTENVKKILRRVATEIALIFY